MVAVYEFMCEGRLFHLIESFENSYLEVPFVYFTIYIMSTSSISEDSSFKKFFNDDMKKELIKVKDMVQILILDQRESVKLHA